MHFLKADRLFNGREFLQAGLILVINSRGELTDIISENTIEAGRVQKFEGIITPGFINPHCHTELSHLKNKVPQKTGLPGFGKQIIMQRAAATFRKEEILEHIKAADKEMWENGITAVGDICNTDDSFKNKTESKLFYHSFIELLGFNPARARDSFTTGLELFQRLKNVGLAGSIAPHAPYSTSTDLIALISEFNTKQNLPSSIHNQESEDENKFFNGIKNDFEDLYEFLKADLSWFKPPMISSLKYYADSLNGQKTILVHNTFTSREDIEFLNQKRSDIFWCFCPNANLYIEDKLPDMALFFTQKNKICIGTDSLASNFQLDLLNELNIILTYFPALTPENLLPAITSVPAAALDIDSRFGTFILGKNAGLNLIEAKKNQIKFVKKIA
jgi:cytosine/adenosine deaminase-related metal-dependent hydrolase